MKTLKVLLIPWLLLSGFCLRNVQAQVPQRIDYHTVNGIISLSNFPADSSFMLVNTSGQYSLSGPMTYRGSMQKVSAIPFIITDKDNFFLINKSFLFNDSRIGLKDKPAGSGFKKTDTVSFRWAILNWKPAFSDGGNYSHPKKTSKPSASDKFLYQAAGNVYKAYTKTAYPSLSAPKK